MTDKVKFILYDSDWMQIVANTWGVFGNNWKTLHEFEIDSHNIQFVHWDYMMQEVPGKHNDHSNTNGWKGTGSITNDIAI